MKKTKMLKICSIMMVLSLVFGLFMTGSSMLAASKKAASKNAKKAYEEFLKSEKKKKAYKDGIYGAIVNTSKDSSPVLLVSKFAYNDHGKLVIEAKIYNYVEGKVVYVTDIASCGTSYPICKKGKYLYAGTHHSSIKMTIDRKKAYADWAEGMYMEKDYGKCYKKTLTFENGKRKVVSSKKITEAQAEKLDYYTTKDGDYAGKPIKFKKY